MSGIPPTAEATLTSILARLNDLEAQKQHSDSLISEARKAFDEASGRIKQLEAELEQERKASPATPTHVAFSKDGKISDPAHFTGKKEAASGFLIKVDQVLEVRQNQYKTDALKIAYVTNLLEGDAWKWYEPHARLPADQRPDWVKSWSLFRKEFESAFSVAEVKESARRKLKVLRQTSSVSAYASQFRLLVYNLDWTDETKRQTFFDGLNNDVKDKILSPNKFDTFENLVKEASIIDGLLYSRRIDSRPNNPSSVRVTYSRTNNATTTPSVPSSGATRDPDAMEIDAVNVQQPARVVNGKVTPEEKERRRKNGLCFYCGGKHQRKDCDKSDSQAKART